MRFSTLDGRLVLVWDKAVDAAGPVRVLDVARASGGALPHDVLEALARWPEVRQWAAQADPATSEVIAPERLGAPVPAPRQVFAIALNYRPHAEEAGFTAPEEPLVFTKFPSCITGAVTTVELPEGNVDWEIEVVAVIGAGGYRIPREQAWGAVAAITLGQDISERIGQLKGKPAQFSLAKSHQGFGPTGPVAVTPDEFADRDDLGFESEIAGEKLQYGRTSQMIFPIDDLVHRLSQVVCLLPGDLIFTGTPAGVGNRRTPQRFLQPGETLISRLDGVGELRQTFVAAPR